MASAKQSWNGNFKNPLDKKFEDSEVKTCILILDLDETCQVAYQNLISAQKKQNYLYDVLWTQG